MHASFRACSALLIAALSATVFAAHPAEAGKWRHAAEGANIETVDKGLGMALLSASVDSVGTLHQNAGATAAAKTGTGIYTITFARPVATCNYAATSGFWAPLSTPDQTAQISVSPLEGNANAVVVRTRSPTGAESEASFHIIVFCNS